MTATRTALDFLREAVARFESLDVGPELRAVIAPLDAIKVHKPFFGKEEDDPDLAWVVSRVSFAVGHPAAKAPPDLAEVQAAVTAAVAFYKVKHTMYYRIGDTMWEKLVVFCLCPVAGGDTAGDRVILLHEPPSGSVYKRADPGDPWALLNGYKVEWPRFEPPIVRLLVSESSTERDASGFVAVELAQPGNAKMGPDVSYRPGA